MTQFCSMAKTLKSTKTSQDSLLSHTDLENSADFVHVIFFLMVFDLKKMMFDYLQLSWLARFWIFFLKALEMEVVLQ